MHIFLGMITLLLAYGLGSIPFGLLLARYKAGVDIRTQGSKNIGATNVLRVCGRKWGIITFVLDALKGVVAIWIVRVLGMGIGMQSLVALTAVIGHIFPCWLQFKGGKGVATTLGAYGVLYFPLLIFAGICWTGVFLLTRISSLSAIVTMVMSLAIAWVYAPTPVGFAVTLMNGLVIIRHKDNIMRLLRGEEVSMGRRT